MKSVLVYVFVYSCRIAMILYTKIARKKAEMGMGTLIIFIAMILVAAVTASVLINTNSALQNRALDVGRQTQAEIGTSLQAIDVYAEDGSDSTIEYVYSSVKLSAGSQELRFSDLLVSMTLHNASGEYAYNNSINCSNSSSIVADQYGIEYILRGSSNTDGYLTRGDIVKVCIATPQSVSEGEDFRLGFIPKVGLPLRLLLTTPNIMFAERQSLYP